MFQMSVLRNARFKEIAAIVEVGITSFRETRPIDQNYTQNDETAGMGSTTTQLTTTTTSSTKVKGNVLLQTPTTIATNHDRSKSVPVRILFDNGSQRSYMTDSIKSKLSRCYTLKLMCATALRNMFQQALHCVTWSVS